MRCCFSTKRKARPVGEGDLRWMASAEAVTPGQTVCAKQTRSSAGWAELNMRFRGRTWKTAIGLMAFNWLSPCPLNW